MLQRNCVYNCEYNWLPFHHTSMTYTYRTYYIVKKCLKWIPLSAKLIVKGMKFSIDKWKCFFTQHMIWAWSCLPQQIVQADLEEFIFRCFCGNQKHLMLQLVQQIVKRILNVVFWDVNQSLTTREQDMKAGCLHLPSNVLLHFSWWIRYWSASGKQLLWFWHRTDPFQRCFLKLFVAGRCCSRCDSTQIL